MILRVFLSLFCCALALAAEGPDQTKPGEGNSRAEEVAVQSSLVHSAMATLTQNAGRIADSHIRLITLDALTNTRTCIAHRASLTPQRKAQIVRQLLDEHLLNSGDGASLNGGLTAGVFPPVEDDGSACPHLPLSFAATPGSEFGGHHSYPGGLALHESFNDRNSVNLAAAYRAEYGQGLTGLIDQDLILAAPIWHDWAKVLVLQWAADGSEFTELKFGGNGATDNFGAPGDSRTGAHHILSLAEAMARRLPSALLITQACSHAAPTLGNEYKVVNWLRAAAIVAQVDPVAAGVLVKDANGILHLPPLQALAASHRADQTNFRIEYAIHNLSDADFVNSIPAEHLADEVLARLAPQFGYDSADASRYRLRFRNVVLAQLSAERIEMLSVTRGVDAIAAEIEELRKRKLL